MFKSNNLARDGRDMLRLLLDTLSYWLSIAKTFGLRASKSYKSTTSIVKFFVFLLTQKVYILKVLQQSCFKMLKVYAFWAKTATKYSNHCSVDLWICAVRIPKYQRYKANDAGSKNIRFMSLPCLAKLFDLNKVWDHIWIEIGSFLMGDAKTSPC